MSLFIFQRQRKLADIELKILVWTKDLYKQTNITAWKEEAISIALVAASNAPPLPGVAQALATLLPDPAKLPSLLKDKAKRLIDLWKNTSFEAEVESSSVEPETDPQQGGSTVKTFTNLFGFYEKTCEEMLEGSSCERDSRAPHCSDQLTSHFDSHKTMTKEMKNAYQKLVSLFASMTFAKHAEAFPQYQAQIPLLAEFSDTLKRLEFEGLKIRRQLLESNAVSEPADHAIPLSAMSEKKGHPSKMHGEKRGLFRNLTFSQIWRSSTKVRLFVNKSEYIHGTMDRSCSRGTRRARSLSPSVKRDRKWRSSDQEDPNHSNLSLKKDTRYNHNHGLVEHDHLAVKLASVSSSPSHKRSKSLRLLKERGRRRKVQDLKDKYTTDSTACLGLALKHLLIHVKQYGVNEKRFFQEDVHFIHWIMSSERLVIPLPTQKNSRNHTITLKLNLSLEDVVCALLWDHIPQIISEKLHLKVSSGSKRDLQKSITDSRSSLIRKEDSTKTSVRKKGKKDSQKVVNHPVIKENRESIPHVVTAVSDEVDTSIFDKDVTRVSLSQDQRNSGKLDHVLGRNEIESYESKVTDKVWLENDLQLVDKININDPLPSLMIGEEKFPSKASATDVNNERKNPLDGSMNRMLPEQEDLEVVNERCHSQDGLQTSLTAKKMDTELHISLPEEFRNLVESHQEGIQAMINAVDLFQRTLSENKERQLMQTHDMANQTSERSSSVSVTHDDGEIVKEQNSRNLPTDKGSPLSSSSKGTASHIQPKNPWKPFRAKSDGPVKPPRLVIEVQETVEGLDQHDHETGHGVLHKKKSLTPVETPSEIFDTHFHGAPKLLHLPHDGNKEEEDNKKLSLSDLDEDEESNSGTPLIIPVDDTLDDITLPDSLHASDLEEEGNATSTSQHIIQQKIMKSKIQKNKEETSHIKKRVSRNILPKNVSGVQPNRGGSKPQQWDKQLLLKALPVHMKEPTPTKHNGDTTSNVIHCNTDNPLQRQHVQVPMKLLVLSTQEKQQHSKDHKPFILKRFPLGVVQKSSENKNRVIYSSKSRVGNLTESKAIDTQGVDVLPSRDRKELSLLRLPSAASKVQNERSNSDFRFLHPNEVFSFYRRHMHKNSQNKFKTLKIEGYNNQKTRTIQGDGFIDSSIVPKTTPNGVINDHMKASITLKDGLGDRMFELKKASNQPLEELKSPTIENPSVKNPIISSVPEARQEQALDHGFLEKVQNYRENYEFAVYKNVLERKSPKREEQTSPFFHYDATQHMAQMSAPQKQNLQATKETQTEVINDLAVGSETLINTSQEVHSGECSYRNSAMAMHFEEVIAGAQNHFKDRPFDKFHVTPKDRTLVPDGSHVAPKDNESVKKAKDVKDSWTETAPLVQIHPEKTEIQVWIIAFIISNNDIHLIFEKS